MGNPPRSSRSSGLVLDLTPVGLRPSAGAGVSFVRAAPSTSSTPSVTVPLSVMADRTGQAKRRDTQVTGRFTNIPSRAQQIAKIAQPIVKTGAPAQPRRKMQPAKAATKAATKPVAFSGASATLAPRDLAPHAEDKPKATALKREPLSERINATASRKVAPARDERGFTKEDYAVARAHLFDTYSPAPWAWGKHSAAENVEHVLQGVQEYAFPTKDAFGRPIKRLTYPTFESPEAAKMMNLPRNAVQGAISGGLERSVEAPGSESVAANVVTALRSIFDPRFTLSNLTNATRAAVSDSGPQMVDPFLPPEFRTDTASGRLFHSALGMATSPEVLRGVPRTVAGMSGRGPRMTGGIEGNTAGRVAEPAPLVPLMNAEGKVVAYARMAEQKSGVLAQAANTRKVVTRGIEYRIKPPDENSRLGRHHTAPRILRIVKHDKQLTPSYPAFPPRKGVDVELAPFGSAVPYDYYPYSRKGPMRRLGAASDGAFIEFDLPEGYELYDISDRMEDKQPAARILTDYDLPIVDLNPMYVDMTKPWNQWLFR